MIGKEAVPKIDHAAQTDDGCPPMKPELKERIARLERTMSVPRNQSGTSAVIVIRPAGDLAKVKTIAAIKNLARRGASIPTAKRAVEDMVDHGRADIALEAIESFSALVADLGAAGVQAERDQT